VDERVARHSTAWSSALKDDPTTTPKYVIVEELQLLAFFVGIQGSYMEILSRPVAFPSYSRIIHI
jgi:hypothetical protein